MGESADGAQATGDASESSDSSGQKGLLGRLLEAFSPTDQGEEKGRQHKAGSGGTTGLSLPGMGNLRRMRVDDVAIPKVEIVAVPVTIAMDDLEDLVRLRVHIETHALRESIRRGDAAWRTQLRSVYEELSGVEQPLSVANRAKWEALNVRFHEALLAGRNSPWEKKVLRMLARHGERYRCYAMELPDHTRDVHAEHSEIFELAMAGQDARAALALEAHICATPYLLLKALREGRIVFPGNDAVEGSERERSSLPLHA